ncbi:MAG: hypothetical protein DIZ77_13855 [endosymbiont of Seepiophila jonesi]|uniref:Uncharacterized protein n=1 Tax=endosymbiont of Lamellibrachia luymesi TaxID=2200907 RepID=A0A370DK86_9GAMM|nr:MAG: hypothetical protein DIZ79_16785 [endosymbiont of Lamellibrachia luymesi]RDH90249.1 MAG: hypothetical protein DIZ77_13855 [endosymbiont of Seepiophila jonesi]
MQAGLLVGLVIYVAESYLWTLNNALPPGYMLMQQKFRLMTLGWLPASLPEMVEIPASNGEFQMGILDEDFVGIVKNQPEFIKNFGIPSTTASIEPPGQIADFSSVLRIQDL